MDRTFIRYFLAICVSTLSIFGQFSVIHSAVRQTTTTCSLVQPTVTAASIIIPITAIGAYDPDAPISAAIIPPGGDESNWTALSTDVQGVTIKSQPTSDGKGYTLTYIIDRGQFPYSQYGLSNANWNNYSIEALDSGGDMCQGGALQPINSSGSQPGSTDCVQTTDQDILSQLYNQSLAGGGNAVINFHSCSQAGMISVGFLQPDGSEPAGSYQDVACGFNMDCLATAVPIPSNSSTSLTLRINPTGAPDRSTDLLSVTRNRSIAGSSDNPPGNGNCGYLDQQLPQSLKAGDVIKLSFTACNPIDDHKAQLVNLTDTGIIGKQVDCNPGPTQNQCTFTLTVPIDFRSDSRLVKASIEIIDTHIAPGAADQTFNFPISIQGAPGNDPCQNVLAKDISSCRAQDVCALKAGVSFDSDTAKNCATVVVCNQKKSQGYVLTPAFGNSCNNLPDFITTLLNYIMLFATLIAGGMFMRGMFGILVSRGNPTSVADAREMLTHAAIGLILLATAFLIIKFLNGAFATIPGSGIDLSPLIKPAGY